MSIGACLVCQAPLAFFGPYGDYTYYRCEGCGTIQLFPMPSEADMLRAYATGYDSGEQFKGHGDPDWWRGASRNYQDAMVRTLRDHDVHGTVLDCGAGWGVLVERMIAEGFDARGIELSHGQVAYAQNRGLPLQQGEVSSLKPDGQFSAVTLFAVFEHLTNHGKVLGDVHRLLKSDGLLITAHPTAACLNIAGNVMRFGNKCKQLPYLQGAFAAPWHTVLFSLQGTEQIISRNGFRLIEIRRCPQARYGGVIGLIQTGLDYTNMLGWGLFGPRWPLDTTHIFVFQKVGR